MAFSVLVSEDLSAAIGAGELAHVEHVAHLPTNFHLLKLLLTQRADRVTC